MYCGSCGYILDLEESLKCMGICPNCGRDSLISGERNEK